MSGGRGRRGIQIVGGAGEAGDPGMSGGNWNDGGAPGVGVVEAGGFEEGFEGFEAVLATIDAFVVGDGDEPEELDVFAFVAVGGAQPLEGGAVEIREGEEAAVEGGAGEPGSAKGDEVAMAELAQGAVIVREHGEEFAVGVVRRGEE